MEARLRLGVGRALEVFHQHGTGEVRCAPSGGANSKTEAKSSAFKFATVIPVCAEPVLYVGMMIATP